MTATARTILGMLALLAGPLSASETLLIDDFDDLSDWRIARNITGEGTCQLTGTPQAKTGTGAMLVTDRCPAPHAQWLEKRCPHGVWDLSGWQQVHLWVRGDGSGRPVYFKVLDEARRLMFWELGRLHETDWQCFTVDLTRSQSLSRHDNPNLARIAVVGLRLAPHCSYEITFDELWMSDPTPTAVAQSLDASVGERLGYLAPRHVDEIQESIVGVNLHPGVGRLTERDIETLAAAGVKWAARLPLDLSSGYGENVRRALLKHRFKLHGIFGVHRLLVGQELANRLQDVRHTVAGLKHIVHHWEIGNEPNIGKFWSDNPNATEFGQMVCAFAGAIRAEQPEAVIISGGLVGYPLDFAKEMLDTGMAQWVDYIGIHTPRNRPEAGGRGIEHAEALRAFRQLIRSYDPKLEVWQSEVQATPNVTFAEVRGGITDFQQARHVARRFFLEQWLDYPASFWQLFKAGPTLDHPGALLRVDGTPTMKFFAIQNVAAVLDKRLERTDVPVRVEHQTKPALLTQLDTSTTVPPGEMYVSPVVAVPFGSNVDMRLIVVATAKTVDARLVWLDSRSQVVPSVSRTAPVPTRPGANPVCRRYPHAFRPARATHARVEVRAPKDATVRIDGLQMIAYPQFGDARAYAFRRRDDGAMFVPYSLVPRPPVERVESTCNLRIPCPAAAYTQPVLVDMIDGTVRQVNGPRTEGEELVFERLPITDYSLLLADERSLRTQPHSCLLSHFEDPGDLMRQFVNDQFGRGRPEFWRLLDQAMTGEDDALSAALARATKVFRMQLEPANGDVTIQGLPLVTRQLRDPQWRSSIVNDKSKHADRYFVPIECQSLEQAGLRVLAGGKPLPQRRWRDQSECVGTWMATSHPGEVRVFVAVPNDEPMRDGVTVKYRMYPCVPQAFHFRDRRTKRPCLVFWADPLDELPMPEGSVQVHGSNSCLPTDALVINLATGKRVAGVKATAIGTRLKITEIPICRDPLLIAPRDFVEVAFSTKP